jgi:hypothetical protein
MLRFVALTVGTGLVLGMASAEDTPADKLIRKAIADLEAGRAKLDDQLEHAKVDKAIRELESVVDGDEKPAKPAALAFEVTPALLKKKFAATRAVYNPKNGELTLAYDFPGKAALSDFNVTDQKIAIAKKTLMMDAAETLQHKAKWKSFTVSTTLHFKGMRSIGISSTNGSHLGSGGANPDTMYLNATDAGTTTKIVPDKVRSGTVVIGLSVNENKTSGVWGTERLALPTSRKDDVHQLTFHAGTEGCGFSNLVIVGVPDPAWLKEFLGAE